MDRWSASLCAAYIRSLRLDGPSPASRLTTPTLVAVWHRDMAAGLRTFLGIPCITIASASRDGRFAAEVCRRLGVSVAVGSSSRGGAQAVLKILAATRGDAAPPHIAFTVDGPRGPAGVAKPGVHWLARRLGWPLVCLEVERASGIRLRNWDGTLLPWPASRLRLRFSPLPASPSLR